MMRDTQYNRKVHYNHHDDGVILPPPPPRRESMPNRPLCCWTMTTRRRNRRLLPRLVHVFTVLSKQLPHLARSKSVPRTPHPHGSPPEYYHHQPFGSCRIMSGSDQTIPRRSRCIRNNGWKPWWRRLWRSHHHRDHYRPPPPPHHHRRGSGVWAFKN